MLIGDKVILIESQRQGTVTETRPPDYVRVRLIDTGGEYWFTLDELKLDTDQK